ncbi:MAG TPA: cytochrome c [Ilumatobacteraceae bacterium]|nr:cytochrome c [Ilumatobacteraceae bacterium]
MTAIALVAVSAVACRGAQGNTANQSSAAQLYAVNCSTCHGQDGRGVGEFPKLVGTADVLGGDYARTVIGEGRNNMPAFGSKLSAAQIDEIVDYIATFHD